MAATLVFNELILLLLTPLLLMFSPSLRLPLYCAFPRCPQQDHREFFRYMTIQRLQNLSDLLFFPFFSATADESVSRLLLLFTINSLTSNSLRRLGLLFKLDDFLGGSSAVSGVSKDFDSKDSQ